MQPKTLTFVGPLLLIIMPTLLMADDKQSGASIQPTKTLNILGGNLNLFLMTNGDSSAAGGGISYDFSKVWSKSLTKPDTSKPASPTDISRAVTFREYTDCVAKNNGDTSKCKYPTITPHVDYSKLNQRQLDIGFNLKGTIGTESKRNPLDFNEARIDGGYRAWHNARYTYRLSLFGGYETDQKNDNSQVSYGGNASVHIWEKPDSMNNYIFLSVDYSQVDPSKDEIRGNLLNGDDSKYNRISGEIFGQIELPVESLSKLEISYRHFYELNSPDAIKDAEQDSYGLIRVGLFFNDNFYIAFTDGQLPFTEDADQTYQFGWSTSL
ncbi:hypothetical protein ACQZVH_004533 [Vibrio parahaemolyticus]